MPREIEREKMSMNIGVSVSNRVTFDDSIHGYIDLDKITVSIIDTPEFQRLRKIKQLGTAQYVYPCAVHSRFEHSLGVAYLAQLLVTMLRRNQPELNITDSDVLCAEIAGLCHDLGHGPFSHVFDHTLITHFYPNIFMHDLNLKLNEHENRSTWILRHIVEKYDIKLSPQQVNAICHMINPENDFPKSENDLPPGILQNSKSFMYKIVNNKEHKVDVDRIDYIARDSKNLRQTLGLDYPRLFRRTRIINDEICYSTKEAIHLHDLFGCRFRLHRNVFSDWKVKAVEMIINDIIKLSVDHYLDDPFVSYPLTEENQKKSEEKGQILYPELTESLSSPENFCQFTDSVLDIIQDRTRQRLKCKSIKYDERVNLNKIMFCFRKLDRRIYAKYIDELNLNSVVNVDYPTGCLRDSLIYDIEEKFMLDIKPKIKENLKGYCEEIIRVDPEKFKIEFKLVSEVVRIEYSGHIGKLLFFNKHTPTYFFKINPEAFNSYVSVHTCDISRRFAINADICSSKFENLEDVDKEMNDFFNLVFYNMEAFYTEELDRIMSEKIENAKRELSIMRVPYH